MSEQRTAPAPEKPSRYDRSFGGLIGAMLLLLVVVGVYVGIRALLREQPDIRPDTVNYLSRVRELQQAGEDRVVYPPTLPSGWRATSVTYDRGTTPTWAIGIVTSGDDFVGIRQQKADPEDLVHTYVDANATHDPDVTIPSALGATWESWSDSGGDHGFLVHDQTSGQTVLVYGSASVAQQEAFIETLTTDPLPAS